MKDKFFRKLVIVVILVIAPILFLLSSLKQIIMKKETLPKFLVIERKRVTAAPKEFSFKATEFEDVVLPSSSPSSNLSQLSDDMTVVTAYFNIGAINKGDASIFTPDLYYLWMTVFARISNPLVVYLDTHNAATYFDIIRSNLPKNLTKIVQVEQTNLWSFTLMLYIDQIYKQPSYPKHFPNTERADYSSAMHAKYELLHTTIRENPFRTKYICWLDIGLFRNIVPALAVPSVPSGPPFRLSLPQGFDENKIAYTEVYPRDTKLDVSQIVAGNRVWVCGCFFIGRSDVMFRWTVDYMIAVERMIQLRWMSTDQQVIYWLYNKNYHSTEIQAYRSDNSSYNTWFYLGYLSKLAGEMNS